MAESKETPEKDEVKKENEEKKEEAKKEEVKKENEVKKEEVKTEKVEEEVKDNSKKSEDKEMDTKKPDTEKKKEVKKTAGVSKTIESVLTAVENMTVLELSELVKALEDKFGVSAQAMVAAAPAAGSASAAAGGAAEEKTEFNVELKSVGPKKIEVIRAVRQITSLGLKEAKDLVDKAPNTVKENLPKDEAEKIKKQLEDAGAEVELK